MAWAARAGCAGHSAGERIDLWVEHDPAACWACPECEARVPRVACPTHGVRQVRVPWAEPRSRFTLLLERLVIDLILQCSTVTGACRIARISWDEAWGVMRRAVVRDQARKVATPKRYISVDEKAFRKGHQYHTIVCDLEESTVDVVTPDRRTESLALYYDTLTEAQRTALQAVAMDMWPAYIRATTDGLPQGDRRSSSTGSTSCAR